MNSVLEPTAREDRIGMLDTTRGIAVLGILLMNITGFGLPYAYDDPTNWGGHTGVDLAAWRINALFFEGTMRGLFTLLFGAGALLFLQRHIARSNGLWPADLYFRRTLWLIALGLVNGYLLLWDGDILFFYGVVGLLLFVFRNLAPRSLILASAVIMCLQTTVTVVEYRDYHREQAAARAAEARKAEGTAVTAEEQEAIEVFAATTAEFKPGRQDVESMVEKMRQSYASAFDIVSKKTWYVETAFFFRHGLLESLGMMLLGMALLKLGILSGTAPTRTYLALAVVGYTIGLGVNLYEVRLLEGSRFGLDALVQSYLTYDAGRIPMTLGHLGSIGLLCRAAPLAAIARTFGAVGQMALSNYLAQSVICMFIFTGAGMALYGQLPRHELYYIVAAIWLVQLVWSPLWLRHFRFGPAEWLWRSLTYWRLQPMRGIRRTDSAQSDLPLKEIP
jgi:uncharacterized protein